MVFPFSFPATLIPWFGGLGRGAEPSGANVPYLISDPLDRRRVCQKSRQPVKPIHCNPESPLQIPQRAQLFLRVHNETLSVVAMCVSNPDRSPVEINR
jgi:hypothetical protein